MSLSIDTRVSDRRNLTQILSPEVALDLVLRSRPSTPAIEEARRISLARQASAASTAMTESLGLHPTVERSSERANRRAGYVDERPAHRGGRSVASPRPTSSGSSGSSGSRGDRQATSAPAGRPAPAMAPARSSSPAGPRHSVVASAGRVEASERSSRRSPANAADRATRVSSRSTPVSPRPVARPGVMGAVASRTSAVGRTATSAVGRTATSAAGRTASPGMRTSRPEAPSPASSAAPAARSTGGRKPLVGQSSTGEHGAAALATVPNVVPDRRQTAEVSPRTRIAAVPAPSRNRPIGIITGVVVGGVLLVVAFSSVGLHGKLAKDQLLLDKLRAEVTVEERSNQTLRVEVAELQAPQRIVAEAERMGMEPSTEVVFLKAAATTATEATALSDPGTTGVTVPSATTGR